MEKLEKSIQNLKDMQEQAEYLAELLEGEKDYKKDLNYILGLIEDIKYDIEMKQEDLDELNEEENINKTRQFNDYLQDCICSFNTMRI